jgi:glycosyltransferase involved in cell wall biosynthesis
MSDKSLQLSICIPAYNRPSGLKKALESIVLQKGFNVEELEIIISDDSTESDCKQVCEEVLREWAGKWQYVHNAPRLGMAQNWNHAIQLASGQYILVLHDDDYLLPNGISSIFQGIETVKTDKAVLLFGVHVVNPQQQVMKRQVFKTTYYLTPREALGAVLSNSSFVRFPGIVIASSIFQKAGYFDEKVGGIADLDMWIRIFKDYGVWCFSPITAAYTVHADALTMQMFNAKVVAQLLNLFTQVQGYNLLSDTELDKFKSIFFHQFILAGTFRYLRRSRWEEASRTMSLFQIPEITRLEPPLKWIPLRKIFELINKLLPRFS